MSNAHRDSPPSDASSGSGEIAAPKRVRLFIRDCDELGREWLLKQFVSKVEGEDGSLISG